jgi:hypothetical protein
MAWLWEINNTEVQLVGPLNGSMEAAFGQAALQLLEKGDKKSLDELAKLYGEAKVIMKKMDKLLQATKR